MILSDGEIRLAMESGDLLIDPPPPDDPNNPESNVWQPASIDLRLDSTIWVQKDNRDNNSIISNVEDLDIDEYLEKYTDKVNIAATNGFTLNPGSFVIGRTLETIGLSNILSGRVEGRSRLARLGIGVHLTAPKIDPGFNNQITLEIFHVGKTKVLIPNRMIICTLLIERLGHPTGRRYHGIFQGQVGQGPTSESN